MPESESRIWECTFNDVTNINNGKVWRKGCRKASPGAARDPSLTLGEGTTEKVVMILSGYSSRILEMSSVPSPDPVPPPSECASWKPCRQSQFSDSLRTTSMMESTSSAPSV